MHDLQKKILEIAKTPSVKEGLSLRELTRRLGEKYPQKVKHHIIALEKKGLIMTRRDGYQLWLEHGTGVRGNVKQIPVYGNANAGPALSFADDNIEGYLAVSRHLLAEGNASGVFAVKATGNSMNAAQIGPHKLPIDSGDYAIIKKSSAIPSRSGYVLVNVDGVANLKKIDYDRKTKRVYLLSESKEKYMPIILDMNSFESGEFNICGRIVDVIKYKI